MGPQRVIASAIFAFLAILGSTGMGQGTTPIPSDYERIATGLKAMVDISVSLNGWALLILGGTLAVMLSTSYRKPPLPYRLIFVLVFPSLGFLMYALERGNHVQSAYAALLLRQVKVEIAREQLTEANTALAAQVRWFEWAVIFLGVWLGLYMIWWIFIDRRVDPPDKVEA